MERKKFEDQIGAIDDQVNELKNFAEVKINELGPEEREEYKELQVTLKDSELKQKVREQKIKNLN